MNATPLKYFRYVRKSTDESSRQVASIPAQLFELDQIAKCEGLTVVRTFEESRTAKQPGRPQFNLMLSEIEKGEAQAVASQVDRAIERVALEAAIADLMIQELENDREAAAKGQETALAQCKADMADCERQVDLLLDMRLNEQINEQEYVSKKHGLLNRKAELKGRIEAFERNRANRFEPVIRFVSEAKQATFLLAEGNAEGKRDFLKKIGSNLQVKDRTLTVEFKKPWNLLADFNSARLDTHAACGEISENRNWRREGDSNPR